MTHLNRVREFPHVCCGDDCAICTWVANRRRMADRLIAPTVGGKTMPNDPNPNPTGNQPNQPNPGGFPPQSPGQQPGNPNDPKPSQPDRGGDRDDRDRR